MRYVVGYRGFEIVRENGNSYFQIYRNGQLASHGKFYSFGDARREVDWLKS